MLGTTRFADIRLRHSWRDAVYSRRCSRGREGRVRGPDDRHRGPPYGVLHPPGRQRVDAPQPVRAPRELTCASDLRRRGRAARVRPPDDSAGDCCAPTDSACFGPNGHWIGLGRPGYESISVPARPGNFGLGRAESVASGSQGAAGSVANLVDLTLAACIII